ncbi:hypothetical protein F904_01422 [Acinetobacter dispersus]|uniref:Major facilitator superfamily (MFS) profile domain-containing protein n=3 Tax=Moraxellaceae TaxID=468 RepID=N8WAW4_9GAMM|nr:hypothetical protein F971_03157 [Acinetobacter vivianii]ENW93366.1 hypothetical protein F904_01422 [Acinetobacter dispersus]
MQFALAWWVLAITNDPKVFSIFVAVALGADILARGGLGWMGDIYRKEILIGICYFISFLASFIILIISSIGNYVFVLLFLCQALIGFSVGLREPIQSSIIVALVDKNRLAEAIRWRAIILTSVGLISPLFATLLISYINSIGAMCVGTLITLMSLLLIVTIKNKKDNRREAKGVYKFYVNVKWYDGVRIVLRLPPEISMIKIMFAVNLGLFSIFSFILPVYFQKNFPQSPWILGLVEGVFAMGVFLGAATINEKLTLLLGRANATFVGLVLIGGGVLFSALLSLYLIELLYWYFTLFCLGFLFVGIGISIITINTNFLRTVSTPKNYLNRVNSAALFCSGLFAPIGVIFLGWALMFFDIFLIFICIGVVMLVTSILAYNNSVVRDFLSLPDAEIYDVYSIRYSDVFIVSDDELDK